MTSLSGTADQRLIQRGAGTQGLVMVPAPPYNIGDGGRRGKEIMGQASGVHPSHHIMTIVELLISLTRI